MVRIKNVFIIFLFKLSVFKLEIYIIVNGRRFVSIVI